jgi:nucleoside-diphosphate-sugar epimerase
MDTEKARTELGWRPEYTAEQTLQALASTVD